MNVNTNSNAGSTHPVQSNSAETSQAQNIDLNMIARHLAMASTTGNRLTMESSPNSIKYADAGPMFTELDQQWYQYLLQLQLQKLQNNNSPKIESAASHTSVDNPIPQLLNQIQSSDPTSTTNTTRENPPNYPAIVSLPNTSVTPSGPRSVNSQTTALPCSEPHTTQLLPEGVPSPSKLSNLPTRQLNINQAQIDANTLTQLLSSPAIKQPEQLIAYLTELLQHQQIRDQPPRPSCASVGSVASLPVLKNIHAQTTTLRQPVTGAPRAPLFVATTSVPPQPSNEFVDPFSNLANMEPYSASFPTQQFPVPNNQYSGHMRSIRQDASFQEQLCTIDSSNESQAQSSIESDLRPIDQLEHESVVRSPMCMRETSAKMSTKERMEPTNYLADRHHLLRPRLRAHYRDRFLVRVIRITYQCSCRSNQATEQLKTHESKRSGCSSSDCKGKEPRTYVTFQAQLPSISSSFRATVPGNPLPHATGLRLGFTCSLASRGPALQDFASQKVAERLDAWEQAGNMPGFRCQVLAALHDTVGLILQKIREEGVTAIALDTDYVFYPTSGELRPALSRRRQLSASSDSSVPRMAARNRFFAEPIRFMGKHTSAMEVPTQFDREAVVGENEQTVWSEVVSCVETNECSRRPRTWHQVSESLHCSPRMGESRERRSPRPGPSYTLNIPTSWGDEQAQSPLTCNSLPAGPLQRTGSSDIWTQPAERGVRQDELQVSLPGRPRNLALGKERGYLTHGERTLSTPVSPTRFLRQRRFANLYLEGAGVSQSGKMNETQMRTAPSSPLPGSCADHKATPDVDETKLMTDSIMENPPPAADRYNSGLDTIVREIANRLQTNPQLPLVVMPTTVNEQEGGERSSTPLVFQLPHPNSTFVCLPANPNQLPRVVTAPKSGTLVVIPRPNPSPTAELGSTTVTYQQPLVVTGPREGYLLIITPDNNFDYIPIGELTRLITPQTP